MPAVTPIAVRVVRRYVAEVGAGRRVAIEYQRRSEGLVAAGEDDEDELDRDDAEGDPHPQ